MVFSLFWDTVSITYILPSEGPIRDTLGFKPNYVIHLNNFSIKRLILDFRARQAHSSLHLKMSLNPCQYLKLCFTGTPSGWLLGPCKRFFSIYVKFHDFELYLFSLFWDTISIASILSLGGPIGGTWAQWSRVFRIYFLRN